MGICIPQCGFYLFSLRYQIWSIVLFILLISIVVFCICGILSQLVKGLVSMILFHVHQFDDCWRLAVMGIFLLLFDTSFVLLFDFFVLLGLVFLIYCFRVLFCSYNCGEVNVSGVYLVVIKYDYR